MFVCTECGATFETPKRYSESHGFYTPPYEEWSGCPSCGGNYTEAYYCDCCGNIIIDSYIKTEDGDRYCSNCFLIYEIGEE